MPRLRFFKNLRDDETVESVWTCQGVINFKFKEECKVSRIDNLFAGANSLQYSLSQDCRDCDFSKICAMMRRLKVCGPARA